MILRILSVILALALIVGGILFGTLGVWGMSRGGNGAWILALMGFAGVVAGAAIVSAALRRGQESRVEPPR